MQYVEDNIFDTKGEIKMINNNYENLTPRSPSLSFSLVDNEYKKYPNDVAVLPIPKNNITGRRIYEILSPTTITIPANSDVTIWCEIRIHTDNYSMCPIFLHDDMIDKGLTSKYIMKLWDHFDDEDMTEGANVPFIIRNPTNLNKVINKNEKILYCTNGDIYPAY